MFNLYQNMNRKDETESNRQSVVTGHDRFCQERPKNRRKRRSVNRRTQSAIELDSDAMITARDVLRRGRSASIEDEESEEERSGYQLSNKIDNLAKILFNRVSAARGCREQHEMSRRAAWHSNNSNIRTRRNPWLVNLSRFCRRLRSDSGELSSQQGPAIPINIEATERSSRHQYTSLSNGASVCDDVEEYVEMEKRSRDHALNICQTYIQGSSRYNLIKQLNNVGSRVDKHWFAVRDTTLKADRLITLVPLNKNCSLSICPSTKDILNNLFLALQHPYICPVLDLEFVEFESKNYVILVQPINQGSLKDLIYGIERNCWNEDWSQKYATRGKGLPLPQIQQMGRQILEALMFLKERGFPTVTHLHSGNVIVQNGVARLAGLENTLLTFTSRIHPVVTSRLSHTNFIDTICFGHVLFEMCAGYELCTFKPTPVHLSDLDKYPQVVELLDLIFEQQSSRYPTVEELLMHDLFRNIDLREMRSAPVTIFRPTLTPSIINLLDGIKRQNTGKRLAGQDSENMITLKSPVAEYTENCSLLAQIYNELSNTKL